MSRVIRPRLIAARLVFLLAGVVALNGCAGLSRGQYVRRDLQGVRSVYVPTARNTSLSPDLQMTVTNAVIRRFNSDGTLEVNQSQYADSELDMVVTNVQLTPVRSSVNDILVTAEYQVTIDATVTYVNRKLGRKIFENTTLTGATTFFTQADIQEGERQALPLAAEDLANNVVKAVTEGW